MKKKIAIGIFLATILSSFVLSKIESDCNNLPKASGYVNDFENILNKTQIDTLTSMISDLEKETSDEIAIVSLKEIQPYETFFDYSLALANCWGVGKKEKNNGILIAVSKNLREIRIQNGNGIEERLTDSETKRIIDENIIPKFKKGKYYEGLKKGLIDIFKELK